MRHDSAASGFPGRIGIIVHAVLSDSKGVAGLEVRGRDDSVITGIVPDESGV